MRKYRNIQFAEGINLPFAEFKKTFGSHLIGMTEKEKKEAYKTATNGNISTSSRKSKEVNTSKNKE